MSFILDALKKLEQKRQQGSVPDLMTVHLTGSQEAKKRSLLPYLILLVLLINAGVITALLIPDKSEKQEVFRETAFSLYSYIYSQFRNTTNFPLIIKRCNGSIVSDQFTW